MATCVPGQLPWQAFGQGNARVGVGASAKEACGRFADIVAQEGLTASIRWTGSACVNGSTAVQTVKVCDVSTDPPTAPAPPVCPSSAPCSLTVELPAAVDFDGLGITSQQMGYVWAWGVAAVLGLWVLGYIISCGIGAVRKA